MINLLPTCMLPNMQCDNPSTVIHLLLYFLICKNHEREKKKTNKITQIKKAKCFNSKPTWGKRFTINKEPGTWVALSISKGVKAVPNEITLAGECLLILARATQSKLENKKNTKTLLLCHK